MTLNFKKRSPSRAGAGSSGNLDIDQRPDVGMKKAEMATAKWIIKNGDDAVGLGIWIYFEQSCWLVGIRGSDLIIRTRLRKFEGATQGKAGIRNLGFWR